MGGDSPWFDTITKRTTAALATMAGLALLAVLSRLGLKDGQTHEIDATIAGLGFELEKSPQALECPARTGDR